MVVWPLPVFKLDDVFQTVLVASLISTQYGGPTFNC